MPPVHSVEPGTQLLVKDPVYQQLHRLLRELAGGGAYAPGDRFPTEREICARFGVSRVTANKALSQLVMAGVLEFRKGVGTFVAARPLEYDLRALVSFTHKAAASGQKPATRVLSFRRLTAAAAPSGIGTALSLPAAEGLYYFERLRLADGIPVILERRYLAAAVCPGLTARQLEGSLYSLLREEYGLRLTGAEQTIRAVNLPAVDARLLGVKPRTAALWVHGRGLSDHPLWVEDTYYRCDLYEFRNLIAATMGAPSTVSFVPKPGRAVAGRGRKA
jgi:DNA-binding GntR family transcriptional regulator